MIQLVAARAGQQAEGTTSGNAEEEPPPEPYGAFTTMAAMGGGAIGAVLIAGVGVVGVFKLALWVAESAGR